MVLAQLTDLHLKAEGHLAYRQVDTAACVGAWAGPFPFFDGDTLID